MKSNIIKISILTSLATALLVSAIAMSVHSRGNQANYAAPNGAAPVTAGTVQNPAVPVNNSLAPAPGRPIAYDSRGRAYPAAVYAQPVAVAPRPNIYYDANGNQVVVPAPRQVYYDANGNPVASAPVVAAPVDPNAPVDNGVTRRRVYYDNGTTVVRNSAGEPVYHHRRSGKKSALIIGASAATGAAIGAIAHGGKGAAIGALAGGAGGLAYDRLTVNK